ncbi:PH domain-containing protein [Micromonospora vulcania]|uniref:PH domain-containing protein n=1 Tax=Micromonospora vulcania TaxID=1441873 RepID=A0ABW1H1Q2_9ACTN
MAVMTVMAVIVTGVAISQTNTVSAIGFGVSALVLWLGVLRAPTLGVHAKRHGVVVRELTSTTTVSWDEILEIEMAQGDGAPVLNGPTVPVIRRRRADGSEAIVELNALGGYGLFQYDASPGQRAVAGLNEHLMNWRRGAA